MDNDTLTSTKSQQINYLINQVGSRGGARTRTHVSALNFESSVSAYSTTRLLVRVTGLEPVRREARDFKSRVSAYSTIPSEQLIQNLLFANFRFPISTIRPPHIIAMIITDLAS